jgi:hypothetical protein
MKNCGEKRAFFENSKNSTAYFMGSSYVVKILERTIKIELLKLYKMRSFICPHSST